MVDTEQQIAEYLGSFSADIQAFAQALRVYLKEETKPRYELAAMSAQSFNIGYGFTRKAWDCYCAIIVYRKHINISFPSGAALPDPELLLHGTGSRIRHLKIKGVEDVQTPAARKLLYEARENAFAAAEGDRGAHAGVTTVVRAKKK